MSGSSDVTAQDRRIEPVELEAIATEAAELAARRARDAAGRVLTISTKSSSTDVVTDLDVEVEAAIRDFLLERTPGASILGEEHEPVDGATSVGWIIDPIDGTVNLMYGLPVVGVSIAATLAGEVVAGAVSDITSLEVFNASVGAGAQLNGSPITASQKSPLGQALVATGFAYSASARAEEAEYLRRVLPAARDVRCFGSAALHLCWVANGRIDAFYQRNLKPWDFAAGALIAAEAGALVELPSEVSGGLLVAANSLIADDLTRLLL